MPRFCTYVLLATWQFYLSLFSATALNPPLAPLYSNYMASNSLDLIRSRNFVVRRLSLIALCRSPLHTHTTQTLFLSVIFNSRIRSSPRRYTRCPCAKKCFLIYGIKLFPLTHFLEIIYFLFLIKKF